MLSVCEQAYEEQRRRREAEREAKEVAEEEEAKRLAAEQQVFKPRKCCYGLPVRLSAHSKAYWWLHETFLAMSVHHN
jgi:hypothetical protein